MSNVLCVKTSILILLPVFSTFINSISILLIISYVTFKYIIKLSFLRNIHILNLSFQKYKCYRKLWISRWEFIVNSSEFSIYFKIFIILLGDELKVIKWIFFENKAVNHFNLSPSRECYFSRIIYKFYFFKNHGNSDKICADISQMNFTFS